MLAKGKGAISVERFREMFDLPEDAEIINVAVVNGDIIFEMLSSEEVKGKFIKDVYGYGNIRRFRLEPKERSAKDISEEIIKNIKGKGV